MHTGNCLCGDVKFQVDGKLEPIQVCHCQLCRKAQGTPFSTNIPVATPAFQILSGKKSLSQYESSPGKMRFFCNRCGSPIYSAKDSTPGFVHIRAGLLNEPLGVRPLAHFYTAFKCNWWPITDALPQFPEAFVPPTRIKAS